MTQSFVGLDVTGVKESIVLFSGDLESHMNYYK